MEKVDELIDRVIAGDDPKAILENELAGFKPLDEAGLSRIFQHTQERPIGIITAFRGQSADGVLLSKGDNRKRNASLRGDLESAGFPGPIKLKGHYIEDYGTEAARDVVEESFFVVGKPGQGKQLKATLKRLGAKYDQDSVLFKDDDTDTAILIGTGNSEWISKGMEINVGRWVPMKVGEFYSRMRGNRTFVFESYQSPSNNMGKWALSLARKEFERKIAAL